MATTVVIAASGLLSISPAPMFIGELVSELMATTDAYGRIEAPMIGAEIDILMGCLDFHRSTLEWKCADLDDEELHRASTISSLTLAGLLHHLSFVEDYWFSHVLAGAEVEPEWKNVDLDNDPDWEITAAQSMSTGELLAQRELSVARSRLVVEKMYRRGGVHELSVGERDGEKVSLCGVLVHMIEEYARHNGHVDLIRQAIDGLVGE